MLRCIDDYPLDPNKPEVKAGEYAVCLDFGGPAYNIPHIRIHRCKGHDEGNHPSWEQLNPYDLNHTKPYEEGWNLPQSDPMFVKLKPIMDLMATRKRQGEVPIVYMDRETLDTILKGV